MLDLFPENAYVLLDGETEKRYADENGVVTIRSTQALSGIVGGKNSTITRFNLSASTIDTSNDVEVEIPIRTFIISLDYGELTNASINITGEVEGHDVVNGTVDVANGNLIQVSIVADNCKTIEDELEETVVNTEHTYTLQFQFLRTFNILLEDDTVPTNAYIQVTGEVDPRFADENGVVAFRTNDAISGVAASEDEGIFVVNFNYSIITEDTTHNIILYRPYIFADPTVQAIVVANWDTDDDGIITRPEINQITDLNLKFKGNQDIISFNELQDFNGLTRLQDSEFQNCKSLTSITLSDDITSLGTSAFAGCNNLTGNLVIPTGVISISPSAFLGCSSLTGLTLHNNIVSISNGAFQMCLGLAGTLVIPTSVRNIDSGAFQNCSSLTGLTLHDGITSIDVSAFDKCSNITGTLVIPTDVTSIKTSTFLDCSSLTGLTLHDGITKIYSSAFSGCSGLTGTLVIPAGVTTLSSYAFNGCSSLTGLTLHDGITSIGEATFLGCSNISNNLVLPLNLTTLGTAAFSGCSKITGNIVIPAGVINIRSSAFAGCTSLTGLTLHNGVTRIEAYAFDGCTKITGTLIIPTGVTSIESFVFRYCSSLTGLILHNGITSIEESAFRSCNSLTSILILATTPPTMYSYNAFDNTNDCPIYIPAGTLAAYSTASNWSIYASRFVEL